MKTDWRWQKVPKVLCAVEFPFTVAMLALSGIADPDTYRTLLWSEGAKHGWNSDPIELLYAEANYRPISAPRPWRQFTTDFNVIIIVLSMFILLAKTVMFIMHSLPPFFSILLHMCLVVLYAVAISNQAAPDYTDSEHPSKFPWYLTRGCGAPVDPQLKGYCQQAKATFAITVMLCTIFVTYFTVSIINAIPTKAQKKEAEEKVAAAAAAEAAAEYDASYENHYDDKDQDIEMQPQRSMAPVTPRTLAFNTLDGQIAPARPNQNLELRHHISMGPEPGKKKK